MLEDPEYTALHLVKMVGEERDARHADSALAMVINELVKIGPYEVLMALAHLPWSAPGLGREDVEAWLDRRLAEIDDVPPARPRFTIVRDDDD